MHVLLHGLTYASRYIRSLAHPGMWWRVTTLTLVMCGASPEQIGNEVWTNHPTVQALIKMVTSGRYQFPTVDCDEEQRNEMKATETRIRDEVCDPSTAPVCCGAWRCPHLDCLYLLLGIPNRGTSLFTTATAR
jgi:hypothetical protein